MRLFEVFSFSLSTITRSRGQPAAGESWVVRSNILDHQVLISFRSKYIWLNLCEKSGKISSELKIVHKAALKHLLNDYHRQSSAYLIIQPSLLWLSIVESAANGEYYFVSLLKLAIFRDQGHIREVVAVRDASQRNLSTITIPPPRQAFMLSTKFFSRPPPCLYTCSSIWPS